METKTEKQFQNWAISKASSEKDGQGSLQGVNPSSALLGSRDDIYPVAGRVSFLVFVPPCLVPTKLSGAIVVLTNRNPLLVVLTNTGNPLHTLPSPSPSEDLSVMGMV